jgi:hypothetical protein
MVPDVRWLLLLPAVALGCSDKTATPPSPEKPATVATFSERISRPGAERLVAIGDLHGDLGSTRRALKLAGAIDSHDEWIGGKLVVVQTGDAIDRGDEDRQILDLIEKLKGQAKAAGGELVALSGNHEIMNARLDFRYVTGGGFTTFSDLAPKAEGKNALFTNVPPDQRGRAAAFAPRGP